MGYTELGCCGDHVAVDGAMTGAGGLDMCDPVELEEGFLSQFCFSSSPQNTLFLH